MDQGPVLSWMERDRYAMLLGVDHWTPRIMDERVVSALMQWWTGQRPCALHERVSKHCWYCGQTRCLNHAQLSFDHAFPMYYATTPLVPCCGHCNSQKRQLSPHEYRRFRPGGQFWFEQAGLATSPLGHALREDIPGFRSLLVDFLIHQGAEYPRKQYNDDRREDEDFR
jgi:hypothetical protein